MDTQVLVRLEVNAVISQVFKTTFNFEKPTLYDSIELKDYCEFIYFKDKDLKTEPILNFIDSLGLYRIKTNSVYSAPNDGIRIHSDTSDLSDKVKLSFSWGFT